MSSGSRCVRRGSGHNSADPCLPLQLLIPWRFFRLWALADGVDAPENMIRCMANNYSTLGFWRSWHRSYNLWIVRCVASVKATMHKRLIPFLHRYIYIPVGGSSNAIAATSLVFTFVALWHDLSLKLLAWGWLVTLFILPEILARQIVSKARCGDQWWYRHVCAMGGVVNVLMMMSANLVGFAIGTDGMAYMWQQLLSSWHGAWVRDRSSGRSGALTLCRCRSAVHGVCLRSPVRRRASYVSREGEKAP